MTNAIEQTRREMYTWLRWIKDCLEPCKETGVKNTGVAFDEALECHLEELRKEKCALLSERDTLRNRLQAFEMASQTSAEIIKGLREELRSLKSVSNRSGSIPAQDSKENASSAKTDPYTLGYSSVGKCSNPFPINTAEYLHWDAGARAALFGFGKRP